MPRRVETELRVTFFSFQDIMMCLTGIMIIIALLLILDYLLAPHRPGTTMPRASGDAQAVDEEIALLSDNLKAIQAKQKIVSDQLVIQSSVDINAMHRELEKLQRRKEELERGRDKNTAEREELERKLREARAQHIRLEKLLRGLERDYDAAELDANRITIAKPINDNGDPWIIVQADANSLLVGPLTSESNATAIAGETFERRLNKLAEVLSAYPTRGVNLLVIVKPSAFGTDLFIVEELERSNFLHVGSQPIDEDSWVIRTPRQGAASAGGAK